ncbi:hypothetical protein M514_08111 [Trichuris suis]|uniref:Uncharacterized protein n=1 Tax=Trichuris suis TaxID=68888 RepID=A0A085NUY8_9BILA|nr:hypothetical protein M513_08111 [Trichuris suis]KFD73284.1 hypothetical protein M514_08111 [Trichuris suis]
MHSQWHNDKTLFSALPKCLCTRSMVTYRDSGPLDGQQLLVYLHKTCKVPKELLLIATFGREQRLSSADSKIALDAKWNRYA